MPPANTADVIAMWKHVFKRVCQLFLVILIELTTKKKPSVLLIQAHVSESVIFQIPVMQYIGDDNGKETEKQHCSTGVDHRVENFHWNGIWAGKIRHFLKYGKKHAKTGRGFLNTWLYDFSHQKHFLGPFMIQALLWCQCFLQCQNVSTNGQNQPICF